MEDATQSSHHCAGVTLGWLVLFNLSPLRKADLVLPVHPRPPLCFVRSRVRVCTPATLVAKRRRFSRPRLLKIVLQDKQTRCPPIGSESCLLKGTILGLFFNYKCKNVKLYWLVVSFKTGFWLGRICNSISHSWSEVAALLSVESGLSWNLEKKNTFKFAFKNNRSMSYVLEVPWYNPHT